MVERDDEIKVLREINLELQSDTHKVIEKLSQEKVSQEEALKIIKWKVAREHGYSYREICGDEVNEGVRVLESSCEHLGGIGFTMYWKLIGKRTHNKKLRLLLLDVAEEVIEMANDQAEALSDQQLLMNVWMMNMLKKEDQARGLESPKKRWSRMKSQRKVDKDPLVSLIFGS
ncbi:hypothetical protein Tco_0969073 [Tanacetum coccineum]